MAIHFAWYDEPSGEIVHAWTYALPVQDGRWAVVDACRSTDESEAHACVFSCGFEPCASCRRVR